MDDRLRKYARLITKIGVNIQAGQTLVITSPIECADFARLIAETAYKEGAREVVMQWQDELSAKIKFLLAPDEVFSEFPNWRRDFYLYYVKLGAAFISIAAEDPELLKEVNPSRIITQQKASSEALVEYRQKLMNHENSWCVASMPTKAWADKVFPGEAKAEELLLDAILKTVRVDTADPVAAWAEHVNMLQTRREFLNTHHFQFLHYQNSLGTDLTIELPAGHIWQGGAENNAAGIEFMANMPTEEVFTLPKRNGVNGKVFASKPLIYNSTMIDKFSLTFKDGKVIDCSAEVGHDILKRLLETDEGASYLGEVALVPYDSPISNVGILFYNTLFDENASCHLAFGKAYPICVKGGEKLAKEELVSHDINDSLVHVDFMIGTEDLTITGITGDGKRVPVFSKGNFAPL
ncbi:MAG: aminopeptidase [Negativicutes bacterium]|nr:aminopeptidase [Negativicutes bacterium]